jgi:hypothetical protein
MAELLVGSLHECSAAAAEADVPLKVWKQLVLRDEVSNPV